jgi:hypothetical protein
MDLHLTQQAAQASRGAKNASFWRHVYITTIILPRQARDKHGKS